MQPEMPGSVWLFCLAVGQASFASKCDGWQLVTLWSKAE